MSPLYLELKTNCFVHMSQFCRGTCIRWQVEVEDGDDGDEDTGEDDVQDVVQGLPLDDQVEDHVLVLVVAHNLPARLVRDVPLAALWEEHLHFEHCQNIEIKISKTNTAQATNLS